MVAVAFWNGAHRTSRDVRIAYTAYSVNPAALGGAAASVSGVYRLPAEMDATDLMQVFDAPDTFPVIVDPGLFIPATSGVSGVALPGLALQLSELNIASRDSEITVSATTFDSNLDEVTTPLETTTIDGTNWYVKGNKNLIKELAGRIGRAWIQDTGTTEEEARAYPFAKGTEADLIRQAVAAMGMYFRYGVALMDEADPRPFMTVTYRAPKIVPGGMQNFTRRVASNDVSQFVTIQHYDTVGLNALQYFAATDTYQVGNQETQEVSLTVEATPNPNRLIQPHPVNGVPSIPYTTADSIYVVTGSDGFVVPAARWTGQGGSISVKPGATPNEIIMTIKGADDPALAPFTISEGPDRAALYLAANGGVKTSKKALQLTTGAAARVYNSPTAEPIDVDNPFIVSEAQALARAPWIIHQHGGATWTAEFSFTEVLAIDQTNSSVLYTESLDQIIGSVFYQDNAMWRITTLNYDVDTGVYSGTAEWHTLVDDDDAAWDYLTVDQEQALIDARYPGLTLDQSTVAPLPDAWDEDR